MNKNVYKVILSNGMIEHEYMVTAFAITDAIITAQRNAIKQGRDYQLVSIKALNDEMHKRKIKLRFEGYYCEFTRVASDDLEAEAILQEEKLNGNGFLWRKEA